MTTVKATAKKPSAVTALTAQAGTLAITVKTRKASAKTTAIKALEPLTAAMTAIGEATSPELLSRLPQNTVAFRCFSSHAMGTAELFAWFDENQESLTRSTKGGTTLLNIAGAYCAAFNVAHDRERDGPLKAFPFYKKFSNALQQWAKRKGGFDKRPSGSITDAIASYLDKKLAEDAAALADSIVAWVLKSPPILARIKNAV